MGRADVPPQRLPAVSLDASRRAAGRLLPFVALGVLTLTLLAVLSHAGATFGYDLQAYIQAGRRLLDGRPLYDASADVAGPFAIYLYPPPFALVAVPLALLPATVATWVWTGLLLVAFLSGVALFPVRESVRWSVVLLAALCWPLLYAIKLGQVEPLLILAFGAAWRWRDRPSRFGVAAAFGTALKLQPVLLLGWAAATRRWPAAVVGAACLVAVAAVSTVVLGVGLWRDYGDLLVRVSAPVTTPHNFTPGAIAYQAGMSAEAAGLLQLLSTGIAVAVVGWGWLAAEHEASLMATVVATQLLSPLLWDHYAAVLLVPVAFLLERRKWWAALVPLACWLPAPAYPVLFWLCLVAPLIIAVRSGPIPARSLAMGGTP